MKDLYIDQLVQDQEVCLLAAVREREIKTARNGSNYMTLTLVDRSGEIAATWFGIDAAAEEIRPDRVVEVIGFVGEYNGKPQIRVTTCGMVDTPSDLSDFLPTTTYDIDRLFGGLELYIGQIKNPEIQKLLNAIVHDPEIMPLLKQSPAGVKVHHCFVGGLLEHIVSMCRTAWALGKCYPKLNVDIVAAGCILHDLAKIHELTIGVNFGYSKVGSLIGHIALGYGLLERFAVALGTPDEIRIQIAHLILSHHGSREHGAVVTPSTPEAIALSKIDELDARLEQAFRLIGIAPTTDEFTAYIPQLETRLYCGPIVHLRQSTEQAA